MTWQPNIHASLFLNIHEYLNKAAAMDEIDTVIKAYQLYLEQTEAQGLEPLLSVTRAWRLVKFVDNGMLTHDQVHEVRRPLRHPSARDRAPLRLRPVQPAGARRQGQGGRRDSHALVPEFPGPRLKSPARLSKDRALRSLFLLCLLQHIYCAFATRARTSSRVTSGE